ncbi:MAG: potassium transporter Kup [Xanthobacteraceae bacterium]
MARTAKAPEPLLGVRSAATIGALGIVYGDIGTSPLYAFKEAIKAATAGGAPTAAAVLGVISLIIWSLFVIISFKYAILIMRADNRGEGGIVALLALLRARHARPGTWRAAVLVLGLVGAALLYGDGAITPAISVLSAIEGLKVDAPKLAPAVVPLSLAILICLFVVQRHGTGLIGGIFGPVMLAWFVVIGILGIRGIVMEPSILTAFNPMHALGLLLEGPPLLALAVLGATFLAVTGGEAMYADMGHFGKRPIRLAWFSVVLPALLLNYLGQGALLLSEVSGTDNPFYQLAPDWFHYPLVVFATVAAVIASQAIISGAFSLTQQSIQLGLLPRLNILHTGAHERGQIYVPVVNWTLAAATLGAVLYFGSSDALAGAYGIAVSLLMAITTFLAALIAIQWGFNKALVLAVNGTFLMIDLLFFAANSMKFVEGGWFPLLLAGLVAFLMLTWRRGQRLAERARSDLRESERDFIARLSLRPPARLPGAAAFLSSGKVGIPLTLTHHLRHINALHDRVLLVTIMTSEDPRVSDQQRVEISDLSCGVSRVILQFGFAEAVSVPAGLAIAAQRASLECGRLDDISYYIGRETVIPTARIPGMWVWREALFSFMQRNAERSAAYFCIPAAQVVEIGIEIEI